MIKDCEVIFHAIEIYFKVNDSILEVLRIDPERHCASDHVNVDIYVYSFCSKLLDILKEFFQGSYDIGVVVVNIWIVTYHSSQYLLIVYRDLNTLKQFSYSAIYDFKWKEI